MIASFADYLTLAYHEARNVRHLVKAGHLEKALYRLLIDGIPKESCRGLEAIATAPGSSTCPVLSMSASTAMVLVLGFAYAHRLENGTHALRARTVGRVFAKIQETSGKTNWTNDQIAPAHSSLDPAKLDSALSVKGQYKDGVYKFVVGRTTRMHDIEVGMGRIRRE